jgi:hypothetical protein
MKIPLTVGIAAISALSCAQFADNFESETGSAGGTLVAGQNGWYNPVAGSLDGNVYTYAGNGLGFAGNATGGSKFLGGEADGVNPMRAQHDVNFGAGGIWTMSFDFNGNYIGTSGTTVDNLGSASLQPSATANYFQTIYQWGTNTGGSNPPPTQFSANIGVFGPTGGAITFNSPGAAWVNLPVNHWYHQTVTWDFTTNLILTTTIQDITAGGPVNTSIPVGWYLAGGAANALGLGTPTAVRLFASGGQGDVMGYDNFSVAPVPEPASLAILGLGAIGLLRRRRKS